MQPLTAHRISFVTLIILVTAAFVWLLLPYYGALLWAAILAILFNPLQRRLVVWLGGRHTLAAALSVFACVCIVVIPGLVVFSSLVQEATGLYTRLSTRQFDPGAIVTHIHDALPATVMRGLEMLDLGDVAEIQARLRQFAVKSAQVITTQALSIGQSTAQLLVSGAVMLYVLFFLFRDGAGLVASIRGASPLSAHHTDRMMAKFIEVAKATVLGNFTVAAIQGAIGGVAFWLLGIEAALLWGTVMAVLSLLPAIGTFVVWGPFAFYMLLSGDYMRGLILLAIGAFVISTIDNLLRPALVGKGLRLPDYVVLVSTLGGLTLLGINGFVIGPLIAALFVAVWSIFTEERRQPVTGVGPVARVAEQEEGLPPLAESSSGTVGAQTEKLDSDHADS
ncbi:AI-2E family transporter [Thauera sp. Sel9]|uniref:AI-2E family transporter n=1 Tax=Thauera sp. Sel9 TaxID=2974299 RepID=UPI0021E13996|nr:AI-2E family transporter [Thauera sp. Sel9]MCV2218981.1 AI-2E family transporter [Thauera sp. Sel9]